MSLKHHYYVESPSIRQLERKNADLLLLLLPSSPALGPVTTEEEEEENAFASLYARGRRSPPFLRRGRAPRDGDGGDHRKCPTLLRQHFSRNLIPSEKWNKSVVYTRQSGNGIDWSRCQWQFVAQKRERPCLSPSPR